MFGFFRKQQSKNEFDMLREGFDYKKERDKSVEDFKKVWETDISLIWEFSNKNQFITAMYGWLCRKCSYGDEIEKLSNEEKIIFVINSLDAEVNNGGFSQFFYNSSGNFANDIVPSLLAIGATKTAEICKEVLHLFGGSLPNNTEERERLLDDIMTDDINEKLSQCDSDFCRYPDPLEELNYQFIIRHKEQFS